MAKQCFQNFWMWPCSLCRLGKWRFVGGKRWYFITIILILLTGSIIFTYNGYTLKYPGLWWYSTLVERHEDMQYAIVVDAGSTGSRVYVYSWPPHSGDPQELLHIHLLKNAQGLPVIKKIEPGLSSFVLHPFDASDYMLPLLQFAGEHIPSSKHSETPLYILATAGMRLLPKNEREAILNDLRVDIPRNFSFLFNPTHVDMITGKHEGIYLWMAVNYVMGRFDHDFSINPQVTVDFPSNPTVNTSVSRQRSIGVLEMGGASLQVAFEVTNSSQLAEFSEELIKDTVAEFNLGCETHAVEHSYRLFVKTFLGFGADKVRDLYVEHMLKNHLNKFSQSNQSKSTVFMDPCLSRETLVSTEIPFPLPENYSATVRASFRGTGNFALCQKKLISLLYVITNCSEQYRKCQKLLPLDVDFNHSEFRGFSEFWYSMHDVLGIGGLYLYPKFEKVASDYCSTQWAVLKSRFRRHLYPNASKKRLMYQCFKSAWVTVVLHEALKFPKTYENLESMSKFHGDQVHWTLGVLLYYTRYFPLRAIEKNLSTFTSKAIWHGIYGNQFILVACVIIVVAAILAYLFQLQRYIRPSVNYIKNYASRPPENIYQYNKLQEVSVSPKSDKWQPVY